MNSRERVACALNHQQPDRVPIDIGGTRQSGIAASTYHQLKQHLGITSRTRVFDLYQMLAEIERPVMERFGADVVGLNRAAVTFNIQNKNWKPWTMFDGTPVEVPGSFEPVVEPSGDLAIIQNNEIIARMPKDGFYFDRLETFPGAAHVDLEGFQPALLSDEQCDHLHDQAEAWFQNSDYAIISAMGPPYELFYGLGTGDFENWMVTLAMEPDYVKALFDILIDAWLINLRKFSDAVGDKVQVLQFNDDFGTQISTFMSVKMFRDLIMPAYKRGLDWVHDNTEMKVFLHSDGALYPLIESIIEMGVDILNPVQTSASGMDPVRLKEDFGDRLVFWGGSLDCQKTLPFGTPEEVAQEVTEHVKTLKPNGGYIFASVHNVQASIPPENLVAMYDTAMTEGRYSPK